MNNRTQFSWYNLIFYYCLRHIDIDCTLRPQGTFYIVGMTSYSVTILKLGAIVQVREPASGGDVAESK